MPSSASHLCTVRTPRLKYWAISFQLLRYFLAGGKGRRDIGEITMLSPDKRLSDKGSCENRKFLAAVSVRYQTLRSAKFISLQTSTLEGKHVLRMAELCCKQLRRFQPMKFRFYSKLAERAREEQMI